MIEINLLKRRVVLKQREKVEEYSMRLEFKWAVINGRSYTRLNSNSKIGFFSLYQEIVICRLWMGPVQVEVIFSIV